MGRHCDALLLLVHRNNGYESSRLSVVVLSAQDNLVGSFWFWEFEFKFYTYQTSRSVTASFNMINDISFAIKDKTAKWTLIN